jgi:hypothetical protein
MRIAIDVSAWSVTGMGWYGDPFQHGLAIPLPHGVIRCRNCV